MTRALSLADAEKLLSGKSTMQRLLDQLSGPVSAAGALVPQLGVAVAALNACQELIPASQGLFTAAARMLRRASRPSRDETLTAVHAIVVICAYFEVLVQTGETARLFKLTADDQLRTARGVATEVPALAASQLTQSLLGARIPTPSPYSSYHATMEQLTARYQEMSARLGRFFEGLAPWDAMSESERSLLSQVLHDAVPQAAAKRYEERLRSLAIDHLEFGLWLSLREQAAASGERREIGRSLAEIRDLLARTAPAKPDPDGIRLKLARAYTPALRRPIVESSDSTIPRGMHLPSIEKAYIDPAFRVAAIDGAQTRPADEDWWDEQDPVRQDLAGFLAGHLISAEATQFPLVVLGHPGAGKSLLTKVLCARVPASLFPPVRVELRRVRSNAPLRRQIEEALLTATGEHLTWSEVSHAAADAQAVPLILLDGFDELLQNTGVDQSDYLEKIREFQQVEADQQRPVAVIVTSRTTVAHQMRFPEGCPVVKLEGFDQFRIARWLKVWNRANADYFAEHRLSPLDLPTVESVPDLAKQPLLLLMLALYDADTNALRKSTADLGQAALYEGLLNRFVLREIDKEADASRFSDQVRRAKCAARLEQLAVVAFAMFNRASQSVRVRDLRDDLAALADGQALGAGGANPIALDDADLVGGHFFFIHEARAIVGSDDAKLRTYEFLHATFGEYLIARESMQMLRAITDARVASVSYQVTTEAEPRLRALLAFAPLTSRQQIRTFLMQLAANCASEARADLLQSVLHLNHRSLFRGSARTLDRYSPTDSDVPSQCSIYSLNLVLIALCLCDGPLVLTELFGVPVPSEAANRWRQVNQLWRATLRYAEWHDAARNFTLHIVDAEGGARPEALALRGASPDFATRATSHYRDSDARTTWRAIDELNNLSLAADPVTDMLLGLSAPLRELQGLVQIRGPWDRRDWPLSQWADSGARALYEIVLAVPREDLDAFARFDLLLSRTWPSVEDRRLLPILAKALVTWSAHLTNIEVLSTAGKMLRRIVKLDDSRADWAIRTRLVLLDSLIPLITRYEFADRTGRAADPLVRLLKAVATDISRADNPEYRLAFVVKLNTIGIPVQPLVRQTFHFGDIASLLPDARRFPRIVETDPQFAIEIIRLAHNKEFRAWLVSIATSSLVRASDSVLIRMPDDVLDMLDRAHIDHDEQLGHWVSTLRDRRRRVQARVFSTTTPDELEIDPAP